MKAIVVKRDHVEGRSLRDTALLQHLIHDMLRADIMDVQLKNVQPPNEWKAAVSSKQKAQQDIVLAFNERDQSIAKV